MKTARSISDLDRDYAEQLAAVNRLTNSIAALAPWLSLDVPLKSMRTKRTVMFPGTMPGGTTAESVYTLLGEKAPEAEGTEVYIVSTEPSTVYLAVICLQEDAAAVEDALRSAGFARPSQTWDEAPAEEKSRLEQQIADCRENADKIAGKIASFAVKRDELKIAADYYRVRADKYSVLGQLPQSARTFVISGYIPQCEADQRWQRISPSGKYDCTVDVEEPEGGGGGSGSF